MTKTQQHIEAIKSAADDETPGYHTARRFERKLKLLEAKVLRRAYYGGMRFNYPRVGDITVTTFGRDGVRRSIQIVPSGAMRRLPNQRPEAIEGYRSPMQSVGTND